MVDASGPAQTFEGSAALESPEDKILKDALREPSNTIRSLLN